MEGDVRKKGMLYQQQQRFGKKWKKVWAEAVADSMHSVSCLELFEFSKSQTKESKKRAEGKKVIVMRDCVKITEREDEGCPKEYSAFQLETADKTYTFASPTMELESWITELCKLAFPLNQAECEMQENTLYCSTESVRNFLVIAVATEAALRCNLFGDYYLTPQYDAILLKDYKTKQVVLTWPYRFVRKFGQDMLSFNFEAGRRCESGEGYFEFATSHSEQLFTIVSDALKNLPKTETSGTRPKDQHITQNAQKCHTPPAQTKHPKKKLTSSASLGYMPLNDNSGKDSKLKSINSAPSPPSNAQDVVYASVSKTKLHQKRTKDYKYQEEEADQMNPESLTSHTKHKEYNESETIYSEVKNYNNCGSKNEAVDNLEGYAYSYRPQLHARTACSDLKDSQAVGFNKDYKKNKQMGPPANFLKPSKDTSCVMGKEEQLDVSMEGLAIHHTPDVYEAEEEDYYDEYGGNEQTLDYVEDQEYYPPCPPCVSDTHFQKGTSNREDYQDQGFATYDNLPKRL